MKPGQKDGASDSPLPPLQIHFRQLCRSLKVPQAVSDSAFRNYVEVNAKYVLTGEPFGWLACSLYFATPHDSVKGNHSNPAPSYVSLANFLMEFDLNFDDFIKKCEKWISMCTTNADRMIGVLRENHHAYTVSKLLYRTFDEIFWKVFAIAGAGNVSEASIESKLLDAKNINSKKKPPHFVESKKPPTAEEIFQFTWALLCYIRREEDKMKEIVLSNTLLLTCLELIIQEALRCGYRNLLNKDFDFFPPGVFENDAVPGVEVTGLLEKLCERFQGMISEARAIKLNWVNPRLGAMMDKETLKADKQTYTNFLRAENIAWNIHGIFAMYYESNEKIRGYDELQFLRLPRRLLEGKVQFDIKKRKVEVKNSKKIKAETSIVTMKMEKTTDSSSLLSASVQSAKGAADVAEVIASSLASLQKLLHNCSRMPSETLTRIFEEFRSIVDETSLETRVDQIVRACVSKFREHHAQYELGNVESQEDLAVTLYYKLLEGIILDERARLTPAQIAVLLSQDALHHPLLAASFEVVLFSTHDNRYQFPWILNTLSLAPFHFVKVIELMIRVEPGFSRDVVSYLSRLEEQILESMAWTDDSPLWDKLYPDGNPAPSPSCEEAFLPGQLEAIGRSASAAVKKWESGQPMHVSASNVLDPESGTSQAAGISTDLRPMVMRNHTSVGIFFRKFYHLAFVRLNCFNELLEMKRMNLVQRAWTCFEHVVRHFTQIMRGRHLDQILMCCIYIMCKASGEELKFEDIMKCYRTQRNAASHIYRSVLIRRSDHNGEIPLTPVDQPDASEDRGDIIKFYNSEFVETMGGFAEQFCAAVSTEIEGEVASKENALFMLSPVPKLQTACVSPRKRVSNRCRVYVSPLNPNLKPPSQSPHRIQFQLTLNQRLPPKNVRAINDFVSQTRANRSDVEMTKSPVKGAQKRLLTNEECPAEPGDDGGFTITKKLRGMPMPHFPTQPPPDS